MKDIKVLGPACKTCTTTAKAAELVQTAADKLGVTVKIETIDIIR